MTVPELDPVIHQPTRLKILTALYRNRVASFTSLRDGLGLTDGNLASHVQKLEAAGYARSGRVLVNLSFEVRYRITTEGSQAFRAYLAALKALIDVAESGAEPPVDDERKPSSNASGAPS